MEEYISNGYEESLKLAADFAKTLKPGDVVLLDGDLGAGKTVFAKGIVNYFSDGKINAISPTFVIQNIYNTTPPIYHYDLYRISDESELSAIGAEEFMYSKNGITLVEWFTRAESFFNENIILVCIEKIDDNKRKITIKR